MDIFLIHHMTTQTIHISTAKEYLLQFQLAYICYSSLCIHEKKRNAALDNHKSHFAPQTVSTISIWNKNSTSRILPLIIIYKGKN